MSSRPMLAALFATASLVAPGLAHAQAQVKIGVIDYQRAVLEADEGKAARARLEALKDSKQKDFDKTQDALAKEGDTLQKQAPTMTEATRAQKSSEYQKKVLELRQAISRGDTELAQAQHDAFGPIEERMQGIVAAVAQQEGFSMVLVKQAVAFGPPSLEITNEVVRMYNEKYKVAAAPAAKSSKKSDAPKN